MLPSPAAESLGQHMRLAIAGVRRAFTEPVMYLAPLIFLYPIFFPGWLPSLRRTIRLAPNAAAAPDYEQLLLHLTLINLGALIAGAVLFGIQRYPVHGLMPMFLLTSIWLTAQARNAAPDPRQIRRFVVMAACVAVFAFFARSANMYVLEPVCNICRWGVPYAALAEEMRRQGVDQQRIVVFEDEIGGNLRRFFPKVRIEFAGEGLPPPAPPAPGQRTVLIWSERPGPSGAATRFLSLAPRRGPDKAVEIHIPWRGHLWKPDGYRTSSWRMLIVD
jgi:hypothetical protein